MNILHATLSSAMRMSTPFFFAGLGGLIAQHCGVYNFALEGQLLMGAFFGFLASLLTGSLFVGFIVAILVGAVCGWFLGWICIRFGAHQMIVGLGMNTLFAGITAFASRLLASKVDNVNLEKTLPNMFKGPVTKIPVVGSLFLDQNVITIIAIIMFIIYTFFVYRTQYGLSLLATGEHPHAAQTAGIDVFKYRYTAMILSGAITAIGGAYMTLTQVGRFAEDMSGGRGWIAIAAIALGRWHPIGVFFGCMLFGLANAVANQVQVFNFGIPAQVAQMIPYVLTILTLLTIRGKSSHGPASLMKPFMKNR